MRSSRKKALALRPRLKSPGLKLLRQIHIGTSGWAYPQWKNVFYPSSLKDRDRLSYYAAHFDALEINSSFYRLPAPDFVARWNDAVPDDFRFCFKAWRVITHDKKLRDVQADVRAMLTGLSRARDKCGPLLFQLPPSINAGAAPLLAELLHYVTDNGWRAAVEFRHASWYTPAVQEMMSRHGAAIVRHDMPRYATPALPLEKDLVYMRFHGAGIKYGGDYGGAFLKKTAAQLKGAQEDSDTYIFFNNTLGAATSNATDLRALLQEPAA